MSTMQILEMDLDPYDQDPNSVKKGTSSSLVWLIKSILPVSYFAESLSPNLSAKPHTNAFI